MIEMYDFGGEFSQVYKNKCKCGKTHKVSTQQDSNPEYYIDIFVKCDCGDSVVFTLPVN